MKIIRFYIVPEVVDCTKYLNWREPWNKNYIYKQQDLRTVINCLHSQLEKNNDHMGKMNEELVEMKEELAEIKSKVILKIHNFHDVHVIFQYPETDLTN